MGRSWVGRVAACQAQGAQHDRVAGRYLHSGVLVEVHSAVALPGAARRGDHPAGALHLPRARRVPSTVATEAAAAMRARCAELSSVCSERPRASRARLSHAPARALCRRTHTDAHWFRAQAVNRGYITRHSYQAQADAAARVQAQLRGNFTRDVTDYEIVDFRCAASLQAAWCDSSAHRLCPRVRSSRALVRSAGVGARRASRRRGCA